MNNDGWGSLRTEGTVGADGTDRTDRRPMLSRAVHDRSAIHRGDDAWLAATSPNARVLVLDADYRTPITEAAHGPEVQWRAAAGLDPEAQRYYLGEHDATTYVMVRGERDLRADSWGDLRELGAVLPEVDAGLLVQAVALAQWHDRNPFCPVCGDPNEVVQAGWVRRCSQGHDQFPRSDPAVIMLVHDEAGNLVLGRQAVWPAGRFSILAGFVEPGESAEAAVAREVAEEVGLTVTDVRYAGSQPWPFPGSLMLGFLARIVGDPTIDIDADELAEAHWFSPADIRADSGYPMMPPPVSIAHRIITDWVDSHPDQ